MEIIAVPGTVVLGSAGRLCVIWTRQEPSVSLRRSCTRICNNIWKKAGEGFGCLFVWFFFFKVGNWQLKWSLCHQMDHTHFFVAVGCKGFMTAMNCAKFMRLSDVLIHLFFMCCFRTIPKSSASPKKWVLTLSAPLRGCKLEVGWWWVRDFCHQRRYYHPGLNGQSIHILISSLRYSQTIKQGKWI